MKNLILCLIIILIFFNAQAQYAIKEKSELKDPIDYVNPHIGGIAHLLVSTDPVVMLPFGIIELASNPWPELMDRYLTDKIFSFSIRETPKYSTRTIPSWIMATTGEIKITEDEIASEIDHDFETVTPYYSAVLLEDYDTEVEYTATEHTAYFRFTFPESNDSHILIGSNATVNIVNDRFIEAEESGNVRAYFYAEFNKPFTLYGTWKGEEIFYGSKTQSGENTGVFTSYATSKGEQVEVKIGVSHISIDQARQNLEQEIPAWDFEQVKNHAKKIWNESLGKIKVTGGTEEERTIFYSALYRCYTGRIVNLTEYGRYFSGYDNQIHTTDGNDFYSVGTNWGCDGLYPLILILEPDRQNDMMRSYIRMEEQGGWLSRHSNGMIGHHECVTILDTYRKGYRDFDLKKAYEGMKNFAMGTTMLSRALVDYAATELDSVYYEKGFFPALPPGEKEWVPQVSNIMRRQSVSITLENCQDDWALAQIAKILQQDLDYEYFMKRAYNYKNVFDSCTGFMRPKTADDTWIEPFDPIWSGGQGGRDYYTENNGWNYTWYVRHDVQGLIDLMGGREKFIEKLDALFNTSVPLYQKYYFLAQFPDMTGWIGMYSQGNENTRYIPYLYNYAGAPWKTQKRVRDIMDIWYGAGPLGVCGDEDGGLMSSWYVLSAIGLYQVCPGRPYYDIGSPIFEKAEINVGDGNIFVIEAKNVSAQNKYIQSATLNGEPLDKPWFEHSYLVNGGKLVLNMGPRPNKQWGSAPEAAPTEKSQIEFKAF